MFNQSGQTAGQVAGNVATVLANLRSAANAAGNVLEWVAKQTEADLVAIGFDAADATQMQAIVADVLTFIEAGHGGPSAPVKDYFAEAIPLIGPVQ
jgi:hypothetical protein